jgi:hypothetical protein
MSNLTKTELGHVAKICAPGNGSVVVSNVIGAIELRLTADQWALDSRRGREKVAIALNLRISNLINGTCAGGVDRVFDFFGDKGINKARIYAVIETVMHQSKAMAA